MSQPPADLPAHREAFTLRGLNRTYGLDREFLSELVREGDLPALRRGRSLLILKSDFETWWHRSAGRQATSADSIVEARLEREARRRESSP